MSVLILDAGSSIIKANTAGREKSEVVFPHAISQITEAEYSAVISRAKMNGTAQDYLRVNETPYVIGESAERYGINDKVPLESWLFPQFLNWMDLGSHNIGDLGGLFPPYKRVNHLKLLKDNDQFGRIGFF